jgi:hypothetical protein
MGIRKENPLAHRPGSALPNVTLHLVLADRALDEWRRRPLHAPFPLDDPLAVQAFHQGAFGPDLGYFPGGHRFLSDLAHCVRSGDLARTLLSLARTSCERAFAWGWVTHVLGDQAIHPWVGRGVGELATGRRDVFISGERDQAGHVRVETGLDAWYAARYPIHRLLQPAPVFDGGTIRFLTSAYEETYRIRFDPTQILASHLAVTRLAGQALRTMGALGTALGWESRGVPGVGWARGGMDCVRRGLQGATGRESLLLALLTPVAPSPWLLEGVEAVVEGFGIRMGRHAEAGGDQLENRNLDTGACDGDEVHHAATRADAFLVSRGGMGLRRDRPLGRGGVPELGAATGVR